MIQALKRLRGARLAATAFAAGLMLMIGTPAAQAYWDYRYFEGFTRANNYWDSASGTTYGGDVNLGMSSAYMASNTAYIASFDANTGYWIASAGGPGGDWVYLNHPGYYPAYAECWWDSNYYNPGEPQLLCDQYRD